MLQIQNRINTQSICSEGMISSNAVDQDSETTLKFNKNMQLKLNQKKKDKKQSNFEQATLRLLFHCDRFISNEKTYFKFPKIDFYLNLDCLFSSLNNSKAAESSHISVINSFNKIKYTEISKKSNGVHIYMQRRYVNEMPWQCIVERMKSFGNSEINEISEQISSFCEQDFNNKEVSEISSDQSEDSSSASKIFCEYSQKEEVEKIDELFIQNKNRPMLVWRGKNKEFLSLHINECLLNQLQYTPEEFQMELALSGLPEFATSHNYNLWMKQILKVLTKLFTGKTLPGYENEEYSHQKEFVTQHGQNIMMDFKFYDLIIGSSDLVVEAGVEEQNPMKKKNKNKQEAQKIVVTTEEIPITAGSNVELVKFENKSNNCLKINEEKRKLSDEEKNFINNHYFKIQDFDFNKTKVCKYRIITNQIQNQIHLRLFA